MDGFIEGVRFFSRNVDSEVAALFSAEYVQQIVQSIDRLKDDMNSFEGFETGIDQLKGDIAEFFHADTFNIRAQVNQSATRAIVNRSHDFASPDVTTTDGVNYGLKFYKNGAESAKAQATSYFGRYKHSYSQGEKVSFEEFLSKRNIDDDTLITNDPIYTGQMRIIPKDQMEDAIAFLTKKYEQALSARPEKAQRYKETLDKLV